MTRVLKAPRRVGALLPMGCPTQHTAGLSPVSEHEASAQLSGTYRLAERVAAEIMAWPTPEVRAGATRAEGCFYTWRPHCAPRAEACWKVSALALAWRIGATALRRLQARYTGDAWRHGVTNTCQLLHI